MENNICNICGAAYVYKNGKWVCPACGAYKPEELNSEEETLLFNASQQLRLCDFDDAEELFSDIVTKYPESSKAYWGLILSKYGIKYETDYDGKNIPTCYAASYESLYDDKNYKLAMKFGSKEDKAYYQAQADKIETIRKEWIEKAAKEPAYDIFISFKDTELENNVSRTKDSYEAFELYTHLTKKGYRVFYSRESLSGIGGEKYEPYIFNALNTAKVMIIYGTKVDYITSTWVKNEWSRFYKKIKDKEKENNSMIVLAHGFNPSNLPNPLRSIQAIDMNNVAWPELLENYISKVIATAKNGSVRIKKSAVKTEIGKKATTINYIPISEKIIGAEAKNGTKFSDSDKLSIADKMMKNGLGDSAVEIINNMIKDSPNDPDVLIRKFLYLNQLSVIEDLKTVDCTSLVQTDLIEETLKYSSLEFANQVLYFVYESISYTFEKDQKNNNKNFLKFCELVFAYEYEKRDTYISKFLEESIKIHNSNLFELLLKTTKVNDVDQYCYWLNEMIVNLIGEKEFDSAEKFCNRVLELDEGNKTTRRAMIRIKTHSTLKPDVVEYESNIENLKDYSYLKDLLKYENKDEQAAEIAAIIKVVAKTSTNVTFFTDMLKFYPDNVSVFTNDIFKKGTDLLEAGDFINAQYFFEMLTNINPKESTFYLYVIMAKCHVKKDEELIFANDILSYDEYIPMLANANDDSTKYFLSIVKEQRKYQEEKAAFKSDKEKITHAADICNDINARKKKVEKVFNRKTKHAKADHRFVSTSMFFVIAYSIIYGIIVGQHSFKGNSRLAMDIIFICFGILALLSILNIIYNKIHVKHLFKEYGELKNKQKKNLKEIQTYRSKYVYYDQLVKTSCRR